MTLLDDVIQGASGDASVATLLRQVKVLAARTGTATLEAWVGHELDGYPEGVDVPAYRGPLTIRPLGHFLGPGGMAAKNVEIPPSTFPAELRDGILFKRIVDEPIATIEQWAKAEFTNFGWPPDAVRMYHHLVQRGEVTQVVNDMLVLAEVRTPVHGTEFVGILEAVRNKILDLALELEQVAPLAGQRDVPPEQAAPAAAVINNHFHGASNVAIGGVGTSQLVVEVPQQGDRDALLRYLGGAGLPPAQLAALAQALTDDEANNPSDADPGDPRRWARTRAWFARAATDTSTNALGSAITAAAAGFLG